MKIKMAIRGDVNIYQYHSETIHQNIPINLHDNVEYAIGVDPSTSSTGIIIGNLVDYKADVLLLFTRDIEIDDTEFTRNVYEVADNLLKNKSKQIKAVQVEEPFRHPQTTHAKFAKQKANFNIWESLCAKNYIDYYKVSPAAWRGTFTRKYGNLISGDRRRISKDTIKSIYASKECLELLSFPTDVSDAYGIFKHLLENNITSNKASKEKEKEYRHRIIFNIVREEVAGEFIERYLTEQLKKGRKSKPEQFEYCDDISPEDNIRCFTSSKNSKKHNVYVSVFFPNINNMRYLYEYRDRLPRVLNKESKLFLIGFRIND